MSKIPVGHYMGESLADQAKRLASTAVKQATSGATGMVQGGLIRSVTLRSSVSPDIDIDPSMASGPSGGFPKRAGGFSEAVMAFVKPEIEVVTAAGPIHIAPWGRPTTNWFWPVLIVGGAGVTALAILAARGLRK